jgi:hypothetical protein
LEEVKKNLYIFGGGGGILKKSYKKRNLRKGIYYVVS